MNNSAPAPTTDQIFDELMSQCETITFTPDEIARMEEMAYKRNARPTLIPNQKERWETDFRKWCEERERDLDWEDSDSEGQVLCRDIWRFRWVGERPYDPIVSIGDVRLAPSHLSPEDARQLLFFCVAAIFDDGLALVVPFSPYSTPGVVGEMWATAPEQSIGSRKLLVVQGWNAMLVRPEALAESWLVDSSPEIAHRAHVSFCHIAFGDGLPKTYKHDTGPPVDDHGDLRHLYQDEQTAIWSLLRFVDGVPPAPSGAPVVREATNCDPFIPG